MHRSPLGLVEGREQFDANCTAFSAYIERMDIKNHLSKGNQICVEVVSISPFGEKPLCEWFTIEAGLITEIVSYFDASDLKKDAPAAA